MIRLLIGSTLGACFFAAVLLASDVNGVWTGQQAGRRGEPEDVAFRFKIDGQTLTGKMFGDEFDLPISEGSISGDQIRFVVTTVNYYNGTKTPFVYTGTVKGGEMELIRERVQTPEEKAAETTLKKAPEKAPEKAANRPPVKQTLKLKRIN